MFVYLGVYTGLVLSAIGKYDRQNTVFFLFSGFFLIWFMGFRFQTGCDYLGYLHRWDNFFPPERLSQLFQGEEAGFSFLMGWLIANSFEYTSLNVVVSAILVVCYIRFASAHPYARVILALLFPVIIIQLGMSGIRQALAGGFFASTSTAFPEHNDSFDVNAFARMNRNECK